MGDFHLYQSNISTLYLNFYLSMTVGYQDISQKYLDVILKPHHRALLDMFACHIITRAIFSSPQVFV